MRAKVARAIRKAISYPVGTRSNLIPNTEVRSSTGRFPLVSASEKRLQYQMVKKHYTMKKDYSKES